MGLFSFQLHIFLLLSCGYGSVFTLKALGLHNWCEISNIQTYAVGSSNGGQEEMAARAESTHKFSPFPRHNTTSSHPSTFITSKKSFGRSKLGPSRSPRCDCYCTYVLCYVKARHSQLVTSPSTESAEPTERSRCKFDSTSTVPHSSKIVRQ